LLPPRDRQDWARLHVRNLRICCGACNNTKGTKALSDWLDEQEGARRSNLENPEKPEEVVEDEAQLSLFGETGD